MFGVIIGDIAGSRFEGREKDHRSKDFELFHKSCRFTDDTVMSLAVCKALMECKDDYSDLSSITVKTIKQYGAYYPHCGYGLLFKNWLNSSDTTPYKSYGNGAAMRVSGCGFAGKTEEEVKFLSKTVTEVTHNDDEGESVKGAESIAMAVYLAKTGKGKNEIRDYIDSNYYPMDFSLDEIREIYEFSSSCQGSVPQSLMAFFESEDFEDAIRNGVSIGGDSDTIAAIAGSVAEAYYGVPDTLRKQAEKYLNHWLIDVVESFEEKYQTGNKNIGNNEN